MSQSNQMIAAGAQSLLEALHGVIQRATGDVVLMRPRMHPDGAPKVISAIIGVMRRIPEVPKLGRNKADNYDFVRWVDLAAKIQDAFIEQGLVMAQREVSRKIVGKVLFIEYQFDIWHTSGEYILNMTSATGACRFEFKSGTTDDKSASKAATNGVKIATTSLFKVTADADVERVDWTEADEQGDNDAGPGDRDRDRDRRRDLDVPPGDRPRDDRPRDDRPPDDRPRDDRPRDNRPPDWGAGMGEERSPPGFHSEEPPPYVPPDTGPPREGEAPTRTVNPPPNSPVDLDFRRRVQTLKEELDRAINVEDAAKIWQEREGLIAQMSDSTYEYLREAYQQRWREAPPRV